MAMAMTTKPWLERGQELGMAAWQLGKRYNCVSPAAHRLYLRVLSRLLVLVLVCSFCVRFNMKLAQYMRVCVCVCIYISTHTHTHTEM